MIVQDQETGWDNTLVVGYVLIKFPHSLTPYGI